MNNMLYWIWLSLSCTAGSKTFKQLFSKFKTPEEVFFADESAIASVIGSTGKDYNALCNKDIAKAEKVLNFCTSKNVGILTYSDERFPYKLRKIDNPPVLLYYRGKLPDFYTRCFISVIGTRTLTSYGKINAYKVSYDLAKCGAVIVSGMAKGIDGVALAAGLANAQNTVAIIGSGIDVCYPPEHITLARAIVKNGCVMTEYPPGTPPEKYNFPIRNRLISAISHATVVIEGDSRSGALITARHALEQGKHIFAFPGNVGNRNSEATNLLIKNGATLFTCADDIVLFFDKRYPGSLNPFKLKVKECYDMNSALDELCVSCVTSADDLERASLRKRRRTALVDTSSKASKKANEKDLAVEEKEQLKAEDNTAMLNGFDKKLIALYKKIPLNSECQIESLIDAEHNLANVMQGLLKLEIAKFITMLPGDRVKRNT